MALTAADCTSLYNIGDGSTVSVGGTSINLTMGQALTANAVGLFHVTAQSQANQDPSFSSVTMSGVTMTQIATTSLSSFRRDATYRCLGASPSGTTLALSFGNTINFIEKASAVQWENVDTSGTNGSGAIAQGPKRVTGAATTTPSMDLDTSPASDNGVFGFHTVGEGAASPGTITAGTDFTLKGSITSAGGPNALGEAGAGGTVGTTIDLTTGNSTTFILMGFEVAEVSGGDADKTGSDSGAWDESVIETATVDPSDTGAWDETIAETATVDPSDTGAWDEVPSEAADYGPADSGGADESVSETAAIGPSDTAGFQDAIDELLASLSPADTGGWSESASVETDTGQSFAPSDTGGWNETVSLEVAFTITDTAAFTDIVSALERTVADYGGWTETGAAAEVQAFVGAPLGTVRIVVRLRGSSATTERLIGSGAVTDRLRGTGGVTP